MKGDTKPYKFQLQGIRLVEDKFGGRSLVADDMGLGKTLSAWLFAVRNLDPKDTVVVVCPANIKTNWRKEARQHFRLRTVVLSGLRPPRGKKPAKGVRYIISYNLLGNPKDPGRTWTKFLRRCKPKLIIADECQKLKNPATQQTRSFKRLQKDARYLLALSGTPLLNSPHELYPVLNMLAPDEYPAFWPFAKEYCKIRKRRWGWQVTGTKNLEHLHERLKETVMVRRRKIDVLEQLPKKSRPVVLVPLSKPEEYIEAESDFIGWLTKRSPQAAKRAKRVQELARANYLKGLIGELKLKAVIEWIENYLEGSEGKLTVFASRNKTLLFPLFNHFQKQSVLVYGGTPLDQRDEYKRQFIKGKPRIFMANMYAAGYGIDGLQRVCDTSVFVDFGWTPGVHAQAEDRIYRIGQKNPVNCYYLVAEGTIEEDLCQLIQKKQRILDATLDGAVSKSGIDVFDKLMAILRQRGRQQRVRGGAKS